MQVFSIEGRQWSASAPLVIAEIGTGHGGSLRKARELIAAAAESGADCAKFQCVFAQEIIHPRTGMVPLPGGDTSLFEVFRSLERPEEFYAQLRQACIDMGLLFLCTPFGERSALLLRRIGATAMKVASPELNHLPLLELLGSFRLPTIVSSGVSTLADIEVALALLGGCDRALLHCVTAYPAPPEDYNLELLTSYATLFGVPVGVSDHSMDPRLVPALAVARGASIIEKHICLSRDDPGLDDPIALDPGDFATMKRAIDEAARDPRACIEALVTEYGRRRIDAILGTGRKILAPSEAANYGRTNRSVHALSAIGPGEVLTVGNTALLRTEKVLRPGLEPSAWKALLGRRAQRAIPEGEGINWDDVVSLAT